MSDDVAAIHDLFWNCSLESLDIHRSKQQIVLAVLARGEMPQIRWLFNTYERADIAAVFRDDVLGPQTLPRPAMTLWRPILCADTPLPPRQTMLQRWGPTRRVPAVSPARGGRSHSRFDTPLGDQHADRAAGGALDVRAARETPLPPGSPPN